MTAAQRINGWTRRVPAWPIYPVGVAFGAWYFWLAVSGAWIDPVAELEHAIGLLALKLLVAVLAITPLRNLTRVNLVKYRRALGVMAFFLVLYHLLVWWFLDVQSFDRVLADIAKRPYITVGFSAWLLLLPLAVTSTRGWIRRLGRRWGQLHKAVYVAACLGVLHFLWLVKSDVREPLLYAGILALLLGLRVWWWRRRGAGAQRGA